MTLVVNDRVQEVSTSTGSGPFVLGGGVTGYQTFSVGIGNTNSTYYTITNGTNWMDILGIITRMKNYIMRVITRWANLKDLSSIIAKMGC